MMLHSYQKMKVYAHTQINKLKDELYSGQSMFLIGLAPPKPWVSHLPCFSEQPQ